MFKEHQNIIWGGTCNCGEACSILQNKHHPWMDENFKVTLTCSSCGNMVEIDHKEASNFYNQKIFDLFKDVEGVVIDLGCGGGFITQYLAHQEKIEKVYAVDIDPSYESHIEKLGYLDKIEFIHLDGDDLFNYFQDKHIDYIVHRDVFMFLQEPSKYFNAITDIVREGIIHVGWYVSNNERMKNNLTPHEIALEYTKRNWNCKLHPLDWYKCGYMIEASKYKK